MKHYPVQVMNPEFCLLSSTATQKVLREKGIKSVRLNRDNNLIWIHIKDLDDTQKRLRPFHLLDDLGTEFSSSDIQKIMKENNISCE